MCEVWPQGKHTQKFLDTLDFDLIPKVVKELRRAVKETWETGSDLACFQEEILHVIEISPKYALLKLVSGSESSHSLKSGYLL